jgi:hypothetical protein
MDRRVGLVRFQQHGQSGHSGQSQGSQGHSRFSSLFSFVFMTSPPSLQTFEGAGHYSYDARPW